MSWTRLPSAVGDVSGYRCLSDCRSRGHEFYPGPVPYFCEDWSWNNFYMQSPYHWMNHSRRVVVSYERKYVHEVLVNCLFKLAQEKVWLGELTVIAVDWDVKQQNKQTKQTNELGGGGWWNAWQASHFIFFQPSILSLFPPTHFCKLNNTGALI